MDTFESKRGKSFVGHVDDHTKHKGWFFGAFMSEPLLQSYLVEVAWQQIPSLAPSPDQAHIHKAAVEINIVIQGWIEITIDGQQYKLGRKEFYVIWPESVVSDITTAEDTEIICVKAPSLPNDKFPASSK